MDIFLYVLFVVVCLVLSAFFSSSETALLRLRQQDLKKDIEAAHGPAAVAARDLIANPSRLLVTILLGNNLVNILGAAIASAVAVRLLGEKWGLISSTLVMTFIVFVFAEVLPKAFAARHPRMIAYNVSLPLYLIHQIVRPLHLAYDRLLDPLIRSVAGGSDGAPTSTAEDVVRLAQSVGSSNTGTPLAIIRSAARATETTVSDIMVPRTEIFAAPADTNASVLLDQVLEERYTRIPLYDGSIDNIVGIVHLKDLVELVRNGGGNLRPIAKNALRVPERKPILALLADMQRVFTHIALVKDEFGVTLGMVTQEDILEELVGEIRDEFDQEELKAIRPVENDRFQAVGRLKVHDFNRETGWNVPAERGDTLAGLVFNKLGRGPRRGESVRVPGYRIVVADVSGTRVSQVQVMRDEDSEAQESPEPAASHPAA